ncbi:cyclase [Mycolicibacterium psychrotolerans]|uniref:Cyclase n=2 Tax=Mycolicibacterium psychrotolerans TaxID=216929 RepID=A0A7I7MII8_9MYCO|nr:cyclase [Mycolicibacterium psychrotolerans]
MDIAATVGAERLREIMAELVGRGASVIRRYGGTMERFTGDGLMALFGAPLALEDHAIRACLAALAVQVEANRLAAEVQRHDGISLRLRVGLNSGQVVAGEIASGVGGYVAIGEQVGLAQRMESVAPPGGVMLSESTAHLVEHAAVLADIELVSIKGKNQPVPARRLVAIGPRERLIGRAEASLVGRRGEMTALDAMVDRAIGGRGGVVNVVGPPGIGKSRTAREAAATAAARGVEVVWAFCESHASDIPFHAVRRLLRAAGGIESLDGSAARARVREQVPNVDAEDLLLLDDLLGIADPDVPLPAIDPDARRRRLTALINTATLARTHPVLFIIEDAQWIDAVSESMLADFMSVLARTPSMVLITSRPEYEGILMRVAGAQTIALVPLSDCDTAALIAELLGSDPSLGELSQMIAERAGGNPFFAEEMVRELVQRGVLAGELGVYTCRADVAELCVPATVQAAIEARIDRLSNPAKRTLNAASVIGARFGADMLDALGINAVLDELLRAELIDQVSFGTHTEYAFRHPLIRAVAYESQLKSDRAQWHSRLAAAIQEFAPGLVEEEGALIAEHLEAAGELRAAYGWHMRAAAWSINRDVDAARLGWERARRIADALPADDPDQLSMRIAPRTMLCATDYQSPAIQESRGRFAELRELCGAAGDKVSLAIGMSGLATELLYAGRSGEGSRLVSEQMALLESIGDPALTMGLAFVAFCTWSDAGEFGEVLRWSQTVIDLAAGDPAKGAGFGFGSPLAIALAYRGGARWWLGRSGWRQDLHDAVAMARNSDPATFALVGCWTVGPMQYGALRADDAAVRASEEAVRTARSSHDVALSLAECTLAVTLLYRDAAADRRRGLELMVQFRDFIRGRAPFLLPVAELFIAQESAGRGDRDAAIAVMRQAVNELHQTGRLFYGAWGTGVLVKTLLGRGAEGDLAEAQEAIDRLANLSADQDSAVLDITLLRLRALQARAGGDNVAYQDLVNRYRAMAESLGFEGHMKWAEAIP